MTTANNNYNSNVVDNNNNNNSTTAMTTTTTTTTNYNRSSTGLPENKSAFELSEFCVYSGPQHHSHSGRVTGPKCPYFMFPVYRVQTRTTTFGSWVPWRLSVKLRNLCPELWSRQKVYCFIGKTDHTWRRSMYKKVDPVKFSNLYTEPQTFKDTVARFPSTDKQSESGPDNYRSHELLIK